MLPLADVCSTQASALISLCRKCSVQGESKVRLSAADTIGILFLPRFFGDGRGERASFKNVERCKPAPCLPALT